MKKALIVVAVLVAVYLLIQWSRSDYRAFAERREDWKRRCSAYVGDTPTLNDPHITAACNAELQELLAYARRKGWVKD